MKNIRSNIKKILIVLIILSLSGLSVCDDNMCWVCIGSGSCYECSGKPIIDSDSCLVCKGSRKCFNCNGTGRAPYRYP